MSGPRNIDPLLAYRAEFPILERTTYLVSNSLGAMPRAVPERLAEYAARWAEAGVRAWSHGWWEMPITVGDEIAPLIGAGAGEIAMMPNVTQAQATLLSALDFGERDTIVMTELDFPSVRYVTEALAARFGARVVVVGSDDGISIDEERLLAAVDERTRLVSVSHVLFRSAYVMDAKRIVAAAHARGALVALDAFHSVGVLPVNVRAIGADFLTGGVLKWLCGGPGGCFLYVAPAVRETLAPALTGWQAHARPFGFEPEMEHGSGIARWLGGTPAIPALYAAAEGPKIVRRAGVDAIRAKSTRQTQHLIALADERGYTVRAPRDASRRGGTVAFDVPHAYEVSRYLLERDILVDYRPGAGIRVAPHFYTSDAELELAVSTIDEALSSGEWRRYAGHASVVT
ncbi:MAG TPA: aminotransferase class V-fold PLP-dependent enzyme [Gemmatimonadaceae bacterium]|nr:aminotransferase class V-fold PLP-dependent enzyme [Gemmatimonadaceae bacterium]